MGMVIHESGGWGLVRIWANAVSEPAQHLDSLKYLLEREGYVLVPRTPRVEAAIQEDAAEAMAKVLDDIGWFDREDG